jgi:hypothetical protein
LFVSVTKQGFLYLLERMLYIRKGTTNTLRVNHDTMLVSGNSCSLQLRNLVTNSSQTFSFTASSFGKRCIEFDFSEPGDLALVDEGSYEYRFSVSGSGAVNRGLARVHKNAPAQAANIYGSEVEYTEHSNTTTNTQYITI